MMSWSIFFKLFYSITEICFSMNVETLRHILEKVPGEYRVKYQDKNIKNMFEIDVENEEIILK